MGHIWIVSNVSTLFSFQIFNLKMGKALFPPYLWKIAAASRKSQTLVFLGNLPHSLLVLHTHEKALVDASLRSGVYELDWLSQPHLKECPHWSTLPRKEPPVLKQYSLNHLHDFRLLVYIQLFHLGNLINADESPWLLTVLKDNKQRYLWRKKFLRWRRATQASTNFFFLCFFIIWKFSLLSSKGKKRNVTSHATLVNISNVYWTQFVAIIIITKINSWGTEM